MRKFGMLCALIFGAATTAQAQWTSMSTPTNTSGVYWDNQSHDGTECNIGYVLTGQAGRPDRKSAQCTNQRPTWLPYTGVTPTIMSSTPGFGSLFTPTTATLTLFGDIAAKDQAWGWFDAVTGVKTNLNGTALNTGVTVGSATNAWGLFIDLIDGTTAYSNGNQFAFFGFTSNGSPTMNDFLVGMEDVNVTGGDRDYNDVVLRLQSAGDLGVVPEPATNVLMATGLIGLVVVARRRKTA